MFTLIGSLNLIFKELFAVRAAKDRNHIEVVSFCQELVKRIFNFYSELLVFAASFPKQDANYGEENSLCQEFRKKIIFLTLNMEKPSAPDAGGRLLRIRFG